MRRGRELTFTQHVSILRALRRGDTRRPVAKRYDVEVDTVGRLIHRYAMAWLREWESGRDDRIDEAGFSGDHAGQPREGTP